MRNVTELTKRSKKQQKAFYATQRVMVTCNTGTRDISTDKLPSRAKSKARLIQEVKMYEKDSLK